MQNYFFCDKVHWIYTNEIIRDSVPNFPAMAPDKYKTRKVQNHYYYEYIFYILFFAGLCTEIYHQTTCFQNTDFQIWNGLGSSLRALSLRHVVGELQIDLEKREVSSWELLKKSLSQNPEWNRIFFLKKNILNILVIKKQEHSSQSLRVFTWSDLQTNLWKLRIEVIKKLQHIFNCTYSNLQF